MTEKSYDGSFAMKIIVGHPRKQPLIMPGSAAGFPAAMRLMISFIVSGLSTTRTSHDCLF